MVQALLNGAQSSRKEKKTTIQVALDKDRLKRAQCGSKTGAQTCQCLNISQTKGLAVNEGSVVLLTFKACAVLTQHISLESQLSFGHAVAKQVWQQLIVLQ